MSTETERGYQAVFNHHPSNPWWKKIENHLYWIVFSKNLMMMMAKDTGSPGNNKKSLPRLILIRIILNNKPLGILKS